MEGLLRIILTKLDCTTNGIYNALLYNYDYTFHIEGPSLIFQVKIDGLTRIEKCFSLEKLEKQGTSTRKVVEELVIND
jgi:hypothetical protein